MKPVFHHMLLCRNFFYVALIFCGFLCMTDAVAENGNEVAVERANDYGNLRESWKKLSPEEREELRSQMRSAWHNIPQENQENLQHRCWEKDGGKPGKFKDDRSGNKEGWKEGRCPHKGHKAHWHNLSPEEREIFRSKLREVLRRKEALPDSEIAPESMQVNPQSEPQAQ